MSTATDPVTTQPLAIRQSPSGFVPATPLKEVGVLYVNAAGGLVYVSPNGTSTVIGPV